MDDFLSKIEAEINVQQESISGGNDELIKVESPEQIPEGFVQVTEDQYNKMQAWAFSQKMKDFTLAEKEKHDAMIMEEDRIFYLIKERIEAKKALKALNNRCLNCKQKIKYCKCNVQFEKKDRERAERIKEWRKIQKIS